MCISFPHLHLKSRIHISLPSFINQLENNSKTTGSTGSTKNQSNSQDRSTLTRPHNDSLLLTVPSAPEQHNLNGNGTNEELINIDNCRTYVAYSSHSTYNNINILTV